MSANLKPEQPPSGWVLYDGDCGVCSRWVPKLSTLLARLGLAIAPLQSSWVEERTGQPRDTLLTDIRLLLNEGRLISGADVYRYVLRRFWWGYPLYLISVMPGLRAVFDWSYRTFAQHRMLISASCAVPRKAAKAGR
jgi:predicted DCC family thiol-disulfide oxidoreductase YuxK